MSKNDTKRNYNHIFFLLLGILILLLGRTSFSTVVQYPFSYIFNPIYIFASGSGESVSNWGSALVDAASYIEEHNRMKEEIALLKVENSEKFVDYEEYESLKQQSEMFFPSYKYVSGKIVDFTEKGEILINVGSKEGLKNGDIVMLGRVFLGLVTEVKVNSSLVRLPTNLASSFEVVVVPSSIDLNEKIKLDSFVKSKGVVTGDLEGIRVENLGINSSVSDGDTVLIRDERVGDILILGTLVGVSKNPASTHKNGFVSPIFDYSNILTVFVRIE